MAVHTVAEDGTLTLTLTREVLEPLGLGPGARVVTEQAPDGVFRVRGEGGGSWARLAGLLHDPEQPPLSIEEMNDIIARGWAGELSRGP